jgi:hypothetical protein
MEQSQKSENESKCVLELYEYCERGLYTNIKKILEENDFSSRTLDMAIRKCMKNRRRERNEYHDCLNLLLQYVNVNFKNPVDDNSTIIMYACRISDVSLFDIILGYDYAMNQSYPNMKIDLSLRDDQGRNFLHYLVNRENQEEEACEVFDRFVYGGSKPEGEEIPECIDGQETHPSQQSNLNLSQSSVQKFNLTTELNTQDNDGYSPLGMALLMGWSNLSKKFINFRAKTTKVHTKDNNNLIHLSVMGRNLTCIKLILIHSTMEDLKFRNKDNLSPRELAKILKMNYYSRIIENFEENCLNPSFLTIFSENNSGIGPNEILEKFYLEDYTETLFLLNQLKVSQSILSVNNYNLNVEWNIFLTKFYIKLNNHSKDVTEAGANSFIGNKFDVIPENILSKFIEHSSSAAGSNTDKIFTKKSNALNEFREFFEKIKSGDHTLDEETKALDILIYNKGIYHFKLGDFIKTIQIFSDYLKFHLHVNDNMYYKWFLYVNISFVLIEGLTNLKYTRLVSCIIEKIEEFLFTHFRLKKDEIFTEDLIKIREYLDYKEVIHQFSPNWDEAFCYVNLLKSMRSIFEMKLDEAKNYMRDFKKLYKACNYKEEVKVFFTMKRFQTCLKVKLFYFENSFSKSFKKLNKINRLLGKEQVNLRINNQIFDERFNENEYLLFYLNSMGIINLKMKKFTLAEVFFKAGILTYKKVFSELETGKFDFSIRMNSIYIIKYNLGLCLFFQKKYDKALQVFKEISKNKNMNTNIFLWYRLGLCSLEVELVEIRKIKLGRNDLVSKVFGYGNDQEQGVGQKENSNTLTPSPIAQKNNHNLQLQVSPTKSNKDDQFNEDDLLDSGPVDLNFMEEEDLPAPYCFERVILQNNFNGSYGPRRRIIDAINYFKQALLLSSNDINCNSNLNEKNELDEIYNFYFDKKSAYMDNNYPDDPFEKSSPRIKSLPLIITSTYINLVFCLSITENWTEVLFYCNLYEKSQYYSNDQVHKFENFKIEALINLRQNEKAIEVIKKSLNSLNANDIRGSFYNKVNCAMYNDISFKVALNVNLAKIHFINNNIQEADKCLVNILSMVNSPNPNDLPPFVQNLFIYSNLAKGNYQNALTVIKYRKNLIVNNLTKGKS